MNLSISKFTNKKASIKEASNLFSRCEKRRIGSAQIAAGELPTSLHRVDLGLDLYIKYRNLGLGQRLFHVIIDWCKKEPSIYWIDLGVFFGNDKAKLVFAKVGYKEIGFKKDSWIIDGQSIGETLMTLNVK